MTLHIHQNATKGQHFNSEHLCPRYKYTQPSHNDSDRLQFNSPLSSMNRTFRQKQRTTGANTYKQNGPNIFTEHFTQTQKKIPSSLGVMELPPKLNMYSDTNQVSTDTRKLKQLPKSYQTTME